MTDQLPSFDFSILMPDYPASVQSICDGVNGILGKAQVNLSTTHDDASGALMASVAGREYFLVALPMRLPDDAMGFNSQYTKPDAPWRAVFDAHKVTWKIQPVGTIDHRFKALVVAMDVAQIAMGICVHIENSGLHIASSENIYTAQQLFNASKYFSPVYQAIGKNTVEGAEDFPLMGLVSLRPFGTPDQAGCRTVGLAPYLGYDILMEAEYDTVQDAMATCNSMALTCLKFGVALGDFEQFQGVDCVYGLTRDADRDPALFRLEQVYSGKDQGE